MQKRILGVVLLFFFLSLSGCSTPKSDFTTALRKLSTNETYTLDAKLSINQASTKYEKLLDVDYLDTTKLNLKLSKDNENDISHLQTNIAWHGQSIDFENIQDNQNGLIYLPVNSLYRFAQNSEGFLSERAKQVYTTALNQNEQLKGKYIDVYSALQNISNQPINRENVQMQAEQIKLLEEKSSIILYEFMNNLDDTRFKTKPDGTFEISIHKDDLVQLNDELLKAWNKNGAIISLLSDKNQVSTSRAKEIWRGYQNETRRYFKELEKDEHRHLDILMTLTPDEKMGIRKLNLDTIYTDDVAQDAFDVNLELNWSPYEKVTELPKKDDIVTKKELDKMISDGLKTYLAEQKK